VFYIGRISCVHNIRKNNLSYTDMRCMYERKISNPSMEDLGTPGAKRVVIRPPNQAYIHTVDRVATYKASIEDSVV
jgi:hypothetical protein